MFLILQLKTNLQAASFLNLFPKFFLALIFSSSFYYQNCNHLKKIGELAFVFQQYLQQLLHQNKLVIFKQQIILLHFSIHTRRILTNHLSRRNPDSYQNFLQSSATNPGLLQNCQLRYSSYKTYLSFATYLSTLMINSDPAKMKVHYQL